MDSQTNHRQRRAANNPARRGSSPRGRGRARGRTSGLPPARGRGRPIERRGRGGQAPQRGRAPTPVELSLQRQQDAIDGIAIGMLVDELAVQGVPVAAPDAIGTRLVARAADAEVRLQGGADPSPPLLAPHIDEKAKRRQVADVWVRNYRAFVDEAAADKVRAALSIEVVPMKTGASGSHPHPIGRALRDMCEVWMMAYLYKLGHNNIDSWFGNNRDLRIARDFNTQLLNANLPLLTVNVMGGHVLPDDAHRRPDVDNRPIGTAAMFVDVYAAGGSVDAPTPLTFDYLRMLGYGQVLWAGHLFDGNFGALGEACWLRTDDGILWAPDRITRPYPVHPACDDLHYSETRDGHSRHVLKNFKVIQFGGETVGYNVVLIEPCLRDAAVHGWPQLRTVRVQVPTVDARQFLGKMADWMPSELKFWLQTAAASSVPALFPKRTVTLRIEHFTSMVRYLGAKARTGWTFRGALRQAEALVAADPLMRSVSTVFPFAFPEYAFDLAVASFTQSVDSIAGSIAGVQAMHGASFNQYNTAIASIDRGVVGTSWRWVATAVLLFLFWRLRGPLMRVFAWYVRITSGRTADAFSRVSGYAAKLRPLVTKIGGERVLDSAQQAIRKVQWKTAVAVVSTEPARDTTVQVVKAIAKPVKSWASQYSWRNLPVEQYQPIAKACLDIVIVAPLIEEGMKRLIPAGKWRAIACYLLGFCDCFSPSNNVPREHIIGVTLTLGSLHTAWSHLPSYKWSVLAHATWNALVVLGRVMAMCKYEEVPVGAIVDWVPFFPALMAAILFLLRKRLDMRQLFTIDQDLVDDFQAIHYYGKSVVDPTDMTEVVVEMREDQMIIPMVDANPVCAPKPDPTVELIISGPPPDPVPHGPGAWFWFQTNAPMYKPAPSLRNAVLMAQHRLGKFVIEDDPDEQASRALKWREAYFMLFPEDFTVQPHCTDKEWLTHRCTLPLFYNRSHLNAMLMDDAINRNDLDTMRTLISVHSRGLGQQEFDPQEEFTEWLSHTDSSKKPRYVAAWGRASENPLNDHSKEVMQVDIGPKCDEVLLKYALSEQENGWVPRPIHQVDPLFAVSLGPEVYRISQTIKTLWTAYELPVLLVNYLSFHVTYGAGMTDAQLNLWFADALARPGVHIICAGDDSVVIVHNHDGYIDAWEGDASSFDHSLRLPALMAQWRVFLRVGASERTVRLLRINSSAVCMVRAKRDDSVSVRVIRREERNTGGVDTTVGNTTLMIAALTYGFAHGYQGARTPIASLEAACTELGLTMKFKRTGGYISELGSEWFPPSFLKGTWWRTASSCAETQWAWGPLLSRLLKISKTIHDPFVTYKKFKPNDTREAMSLHAVAVAKSMAVFSWPKPLLVWLQSFVGGPHAHELAPAVEDIIAPWKPQGVAGLELDDTNWAEQAADWYGVQADEIVAFVDHVCTLRVGHFSFHPMWVKMALRDYN